MSIHKLSEQAIFDLHGKPFGNQKKDVSDAIGDTIITFGATFIFFASIAKAYMTYKATQDLDVKRKNIVSLYPTHPNDIRLQHSEKIYDSLIAEKKVKFLAFIIMTIGTIALLVGAAIYLANGYVLPKPLAIARIVILSTIGFGILLGLSAEIYSSVQYYRQLRSSENLISSLNQRQRH